MASQFAQKSTEKFKEKLQKLGISPKERQRLMARKLKYQDSDPSNYSSFGEAMPSMIGPQGFSPKLDYASHGLPDNEQLDNQLNSMPSIQYGTWDNADNQSFLPEDDQAEDIHLKLDRIVSDLDEERVTEVLQMINDARDVKSQAFDRLVRLTKRTKEISEKGDQATPFTEKEIEEFEQLMKDVDMAAELNKAGSIGLSEEEALEQAANQILDCRKSFKKNISKAEIDEIERSMVESFMEGPEDAEILLNRVKLIENLTSEERKKRLQSLHIAQLKQEDAKLPMLKVTEKVDAVPYTASSDWIKHMRKSRSEKRKKIN